MLKKSSSKLHIGYGCVPSPPATIKKHGRIFFGYCWKNILSKASPSLYDLVILLISNKNPFLIIIIYIIAMNEMTSYIRLYFKSRRSTFPRLLLYESRHTSSFDQYNCRRGALNADQRMEGTQNRRENYIRVRPSSIYKGLYPTLIPPPLSNMRCIYTHIHRKLLLDVHIPCVDERGFSPFLSVNREQREIDCPGAEQQKKMSAGRES